MTLDLVFLLFLCLSALAIGGAWLRVLGIRVDHRTDFIALAIPLGLGSQALLVLGLGQFGLLRTEFFLVCGLLSLVLLRWCEWPRGVSPGSQRWYWVWDSLLAAGLVGTFLTSLLPVTDGDALCYHLQVPKIFLNARSVGFDADLHETVYPLTVEMLYCVALALRGPVACRLVEWLLGVVLALNVAAMARPWLGDRSRWAATIALLVPAVSNGMGAPLNDVALAAFANAALFAWTRWSETPSRSWAIVAGALMGFSIGVKFPGLVLLGVVGIALLARCIRQARWSDLLLFGLSVVVVGSVWYVRAYLYTGNPVHPFFRHVFGGAGLDEVLDPIKRPLAVNPFNILTALVPMTLDPARFDSFSHQFGPLFLLFLPLLLLDRPPRRLEGLVLVGFAFLCICLTQRQSMRFVLIALGPFSIGVGWLAIRWWTTRSRITNALLVLMLACLTFEASLALARPRVGFAYLIGRESAATYLSRREPTYVVGQWIDSHLPTDTRLIGQDHRGFYLPRPYVMELAHRRRTGVGSTNTSADKVIAELRAEGFTHLMLCPPQPIDAIEFDPTLGKVLKPWLEQQKPVYRRELADADNVMRCYSIYALNDPVAITDLEGKRR